MKIPAGQHKIEFKFEPQSYYTGETITLIFSLLILFAFLGLIGYELYQKKLAMDRMPVEKTPVKPKRELPKTKSKGKSKNKGKGK